MNKSSTPAYRLIVVIVTSSFCASGLAQSAPLTAPFTLARHIMKNNNKTKCELPVPAPVVELELLSFYDQDDNSRSTIVPAQKKAYDEAIAGAKLFTSLVAKAASNYTQTDGNRLDSAACALKVLSVWAKADALSVFKTRQSALSATRMIAGAAMGYLQVRNAAPLLGVDTALIDDWFSRRAKDIIPIYTESGEMRSNIQNHRYWGGFAVAAIGVAIGNKDYLQFGIDSYKIGVCQVTSDGALPLELARKKKARDYHLHASAPLVMIGSLAVANGQNIFGECNNGLQRLVNFALNAINNPSDIERLTGETMVKLPIENGKIRDDRIAWLPAYLYYFPKDKAKFSDLYTGSLFSASLGGRVSIMYDVSLRN